MFTQSIDVSSQGGEIIQSSGIGVGLTTARSLSSALGGEIKLFSQKNVGTSINFSV